MVNVSVLLANGCSSTSIAATLEGFECANTLYSLRTKSLQPQFKVSTVSGDTQPVQCSGGLTIIPNHSIESYEPTDIVIIPGFLFQILPLLPSLSALFPWLQRQYQQGATIAAMCTGSFVAAEAGILEGKIATTHWLFAQAFRQRYPKVNLQENQIVTDDQNTICSGGATAGNDMLLHVIRKFGSPQLASECSKKLLIDSNRHDQTPYILPHLSQRHEDEPIRVVQCWLEEHYNEAISFDALAAQFGFSTRNFIRRFKCATNQTPVQYLQAIRLEQAKHLLETTKLTIESITFKVGYEDSNSFRRLFKARVGVSPGSYRKKFRI